MILLDSSCTYTKEVMIATRMKKKATMQKAAREVEFAFDKTDHSNAAVLVQTTIKLTLVLQLRCRHWFPRLMHSAPFHKSSLKHQLHFVCICSCIQKL